MGNSSSKITQQDRAILQVKLQRDKLTQYQTNLSHSVGQQRLLIKEKLTHNDKTAAKMLLKRMKYQEKLIENVGDQVMNLENMIRTIEFKLIEKQFLTGLKQGNELLKKLNNEMSLNEVEALMDDVRENVAYQKEIDAALSESVIGRDYEDEIDEELAQLEREIKGDIVGDKLPDMPTVAGLGKIHQENKVKEPEPASNSHEREALLA